MSERGFGVYEERLEREREAVLRRLVCIRKMVAGDDQAAFARKVGIAPFRWNNREQGRFPLTPRYLFQIVNRIDGLSVGYIVSGETKRLSPAVARKLAALEAELFSSQKKGAA